MATKPYQPLDPNALYLVRNERWEDKAIWGVDLTLAEAQKLKEVIAGRRLSKTVMLEVMPAEEELATACRELVLELPDHSSRHRYLVKNAKFWGVDLTLAEAQKLKEVIAGRRLCHQVRIEPMTDLTDEHLAAPIGLEAALAALVDAVPTPRVPGTPRPPTAAAGVVVGAAPPLERLTGSTSKPPATAATSVALSAGAAAAAEANARVAARTRALADPVALMAAAKAQGLDDGVVNVLAVLQGEGVSPEGLNLSPAELAEYEALDQMPLEDLVGDDLASDVG